MPWKFCHEPCSARLWDNQAIVTGVLVAKRQFYSILFCSTSLIFGWFYFYLYEPEDWKRYNYLDGDGDERYIDIIDILNYIVDILICHIEILWNSRPKAHHLGCMQQKIWAWLVLTRELDWACGSRCGRPHPSSRGFAGLGVVSRQLSVPAQSYWFEW